MSDDSTGSSQFQFSTAALYPSLQTDGNHALHNRIRPKMGGLWAESANARIENIFRDFERIGEDAFSFETAAVYHSGAGLGGAVGSLLDVASLFLTAA